MRNILCSVLILGFIFGTDYAEPANINLKCGCVVEDIHDNPACKCERGDTGEDKLYGNKIFNLKGGATKGIRAECTGKAYDPDGKHDELAHDHLHYNNVGIKEGGA